MPARTQLHPADVDELHNFQNGTQDSCSTSGFVQWSSNAPISKHWSCSSVIWVGRSSNTTCYLGGPFTFGTYLLNSKHLHLSWYHLYIPLGTVSPLPLNHPSIMTTLCMHAIQDTQLHPADAGEPQDYQNVSQVS